MNRQQNDRRLGPQDKFLRGALIVFLSAHGVYLLGGHVLIGSLYRGGVITAVNKTLGYADKTIGHYYELADKGFFLLAGTGFLLVVLTRLVRSSARINLGWVAGAFLYLQGGMYLLNPAHRVYSYHGFFHAGIVYELLSGGLPPENPFLAGEPLLYSWAFHLLPAGVTALLKVSCFWSFALVNMVSLVLAIVLVFKIAQTLVEDHRSNVFSVVVALFGTTLLAPSLLLWLSHISGVRFEPRGLPVFLKFTTISGSQVGVVCFLVFLWGMVRWIKKGLVWSSAALVFLGVVGVSFLYPAMLVGSAATAGSAWLVTLRARARGSTSISRVGLAVMASVMALGVLVAIPYLTSISSGVGLSEMLPEGRTMAYKAISWLLLVGPLAVLVVLGRRRLHGRVDRTTFQLLASGGGAAAVAYVFSSLPMGSEYKALMLSAMMFGILAGAGLHRLSQGARRRFAFVFLLVLLWPVVSIVFHGMQRLRGLGDTFSEEGQYLVSCEEGESEMYRWIREQTAVESVFVDSVLDIPVYGQRSLYIGAEDGWNGRGFELAFLERVCGYPARVLEERYGVLQAVYRGGPIGDWSKLEQFAAARPVYVISRPESPISNDLRPIVAEVFCSYDKQVRVYRLRAPGGRSQ